MIELIKEYVTAERVTMVISVLTTLLTVFKMARTMVNLKKTNELNLGTVTNEVQKTVEEVVQNTTNEAIKEVLTPIQEQIAQINPVLQTFSKILALSQENTPESRIAILELIQTLGNDATKLIEQTKDNINNQIVEEEAKKEETIAKLDELGRV